MSLVSMKTKGEACMPCGDQEYGYGLCLNLNDDQTEALGIKTPLAAGTVVQITAMAYVQTISQSVDSDEDGKTPDIRMSLQITDMELSPAKSAKSISEVGDSLYGAK